MRVMNGRAIYRLRSARRLLSINKPWKNHAANGHKAGGAM
jgi:hypothetical protein